MHFETKAIRHQINATGEKEHSSPIYPTSSFIYENAEEMRAVFADEQQGNIYSRFTNPNVREFEEKIASLEGVNEAVATSSGMAAVTATFLSLLKNGDHLLASRAVFGSTHIVAGQFLKHYGIEVSWVDPVDSLSWKKEVRPETKMFYLETPSNPGLEIVDLESAKALCTEHNLLLVVDNCFATPYLQQPVRFGADLIIHSATKYLDGQGRILGGVVAGERQWIEQIRKFCRSTGPSLSPFNAWILSKSLETLAVRMDRHCYNAATLYERLRNHTAISNLRYPLAPDHPQYTLAKKQMTQGGGILTFELKGGIESGRKFLDSLQMISLTANLGDTRSIASHPFSTTHAKVSPDMRQISGITEGLIRISVGLEHIDDISADIVQALNNSTVTG